MKPTPALRKYLLACTFSAALAFCFALSPAHAATLYWDGATPGGDADGGAGTWNTASNWSTAAAGGSAVAWNNTPPDAAVFGGVGGLVTLGAARSASGITFTSGGYVIRADSGKVLTIGAGGITQEATAGSQNNIGDASTPGYVTLSASQSWTNNSNQNLFQRDGNLVLGAHTLTFTSPGGGAIIAAGTTTGSGNIIVGANTAVSMSGTNSYSGTTTINSGAILTINSLKNFNAAGGLGTKSSNFASNLVIDGGTLRVQVESATSNRLFTMGAGGATLEARLTGANSGQILLNNTAALAYTATGDRTLTLGGNSDDAGGSSIALAIGDVGGGNGTVALAKIEAHHWTVNGNNSYSGGTTVNAGTLTMGSATALGANTGSLTVNGGILDMAGNNLIVGNLTGSGGVISGTSGTRTLTIGNGGATGGNFQGVIQNGSGGTTSLTKVTGGTQTLSGTNTYTGATTVNRGTLSISSTGSINSTSGVTIGIASTEGTSEFNFNSSTALNKPVSFAADSTGGTLSGSGTIDQTVHITAGNTLSIGNSIGQMNFGDALILAGVNVVEIDGTAGAGLAGGHDFANVTGALTYGGALTLDFGTTLGVGGYTWNLFDFSSETGTFASITLTDQYSGSLLDGDLDGIWDLTSGSNTWQFTESSGVLGLTVIPEPRAALLGGLGLLMLLRRRR